MPKKSKTAMMEMAKMEKGPKAGAHAAKKGKPAKFKKPY